MTPERSDAIWRTLRSAVIEAAKRHSSAVDVGSPWGLVVILDRDRMVLSADTAHRGATVAMRFASEDEDIPNSFRVRFIDGDPPRFALGDGEPIPAEQLADELLRLFVDRDVG